MPVCVPDTSCLIHLERIDRLDLLRTLYDDLRIPPAVRDEYGGVPDGIALVDSPSRPFVRLLRRTVDAGEAEVIALGTDLDAAHVVLDDAAARAEARDLDVTVVGTIGPADSRVARGAHFSRTAPSRRSSGEWVLDVRSPVPACPPQGRRAMTRRRTKENRFAPLGDERPGLS